MTDPHPLTRRQKLLAARSVQLGNVAEVLVDRFDYTNQVFNLEGDVMEAEAKAEVFNRRLQLIQQKAEDFRNSLEHPEPPAITVAKRKPRNPKPDHIWFDTVYLQIFIYQDQWVEIG